VTYLLSQVDAHSLPDHHYLEPGDEVYYLREYTSRRGYSYGETNSLISNLKKTIDRRRTPEWKYKGSAIMQLAEELRRTVDHVGFTWVPVPPSKAKSDPLYDDRMLRVLQGAFPQGDIRELVLQTASTPAGHTTDDSKPPPSDLAAKYRIDRSLGRPQPRIAVFDDVLTTGSHFKAMQQVLTAAFSGVAVYGLFIARRVFPDDE